MTDSQPTEQPNLHDPIVRRPSAKVRVSVFLGKAVLLFLLILVGIFVWNSTPLSQWMREANAKTAQAADSATSSREQARLVFDEKTAQIDANRTQHQKLVDDASDAIAKLDELAKLREEWLSTSTSLARGSDGAELAADEDLVAAYVQITTTRTPPPINTAALKTRVDAIRAMSRERINQEGFAAAPAASLQEEVASASRTAVQNVDLYRQANLELQALIEQGRTDGIPATKDTLTDAVHAYQTRGKQQELAAYTSAVENAMKGMEARILASAEAAAKAREEDRAKFYEEQLAQLRIHEQKVQGLDLERQKTEQTAEQKRIAQDIALKDAEAKKQQEERDREKKKVEDDAKKKQLIARCKSADVQQRLRYFLTPGYWQPANKPQSLEMEPMSFSALREWGALEETLTGVVYLYNLAWDPKDTIRPRLPKWEHAYPKDGKTWRGKHPQQYQDTRDLQLLLIELGPTLVELGMLKP